MNEPKKYTRPWWITQKPFVRVTCRVCSEVAMFSNDAADELSAPFREIHTWAKQYSCASCKSNGGVKVEWVSGR